MTEFKFLEEFFASISICSWVPPISFAITLSYFPKAKRLNSCFSRGLNITTHLPTSSAGEVAFPFGWMCRSVPMAVQCMTRKTKATATEQTS